MLLRDLLRGRDFLKCQQQRHMRLFYHNIQPRFCQARRDAERSMTHLQMCCKLSQLASTCRRSMRICASRSWFTADSVCRCEAASSLRSASPADCAAASSSRRLSSTLLPGAPAMCRHNQFANCHANYTNRDCSGPADGPPMLYRCLQPASPSPLLLHVSLCITSQYASCSPGTEGAPGRQCSQA